MIFSGAIYVVTFNDKAFVGLNYTFQISGSGVLMTNFSAFISSKGESGSLLSFCSLFLSPRT